MKGLRDPVHDYVYVGSDFIEYIVDTEHFQRLRNIRQLDTARTVYPSATHSRFEHTLGVFHLASVAFDSLESQFRSELPNDDDEEDNDELELIRNTLKSACLLHDIGHFPFSHLGEGIGSEEEINNELKRYHLEEVFDRVQKKEKYDSAGLHEKVACLIVLDEYRTDLRSMGLDPIEVCAFMLGTSVKWFKNDAWKVAPQILNSNIDVDRLDYMLRDDFMTGSSFVSVDSERFVKAYSIPDRDLALSDKALSTIGNYLDGRLSVYRWITQHHKVVYTNLLLEDMITETLETSDRISNDADSTFPSEMVRRELIDDIELMALIRETEQNNDNTYLSDLLERWRSRDYLLSCWKHYSDYHEWIGSWNIHTHLESTVRSERKKVEERFIDHLDVEDEEFMCGVSKVPGYNTGEISQIAIDVNDESVPINELDLYDSDRRKYENIPFFFTNSEENVDEVKSYIEDNPPPWFL